MNIISLIQYSFANHFSIIIDTHEGLIKKKKNKQQKTKIRVRKII